MSRIPTRDQLHDALVKLSSLQQWPVSLIHMVIDYMSNTRLLMIGQHTTTSLTILSLDAAMIATPTMITQPKKWQWWHHGLFHTTMESTYTLDTLHQRLIFVGGRNDTCTTQLCSYWNVADLLQSSTPLSRVERAAPKPTLVTHPLPPVLTSRWSAMNIQLTGERAHQWLICGGLSLASVECFDMRHGTWSPDSTMTTARGGAAIALHRHTGRVYIFGGVAGTRSQVVGTVEHYSPATRTWQPVTTPTAVMNEPRARAAAIYVPHLRGFIIGGGCANSRSPESLSTLEFFSPYTDTFTPLAPKFTLPVPCEEHTFHLIHDHILVLMMSASSDPSTLPPGYLIDLAPYTTVDDIARAKKPLKWLPLPLIPNTTYATRSVILP